MLKASILFLVVLATVLVTSCAASPDAIPAASVSTAPYNDLTCDQLKNELRIAVDQRDAYVKRQKGNRTRDILLNSLVLVGSGAITSDHEEEVANSKGKVLMLEGMIESKCK